MEVQLNPALNLKTFLNVITGLNKTKYRKWFTGGASVKKTTIYTKIEKGGFFYH